MAFHYSTAVVIDLGISLGKTGKIAKVFQPGSNSFQKLPVQRVRVKIGPVGPEWVLLIIYKIPVFATFSIKSAVRTFGYRKNPPNTYVAGQNGIQAIHQFRIQVFINIKVKI